MIPVRHHHHPHLPSLLSPSSVGRLWRDGALKCITSAISAHNACYHVTTVSILSAHNVNTAALALCYGPNDKRLLYCTVLMHSTRIEIHNSFDCVINRAYLDFLTVLPRYSCCCSSNLYRSGCLSESFIPGHSTDLLVAISYSIMSDTDFDRC
jgi:hypothetical protein